MDNYALWSWAHSGLEKCTFLPTKTIEGYGVKKISLLQKPNTFEETSIA